MKEEDSAAAPRVDPVPPAGPQADLILIAEVEPGRFAIIWREPDGHLRQRTGHNRRNAEELVQVLECRLGIDARRENYDRHVSKSGQVPR
jgi:hypothetical protein